MGNIMVNALQLLTVTTLQCYCVQNFVSEKLILNLKNQNVLPCRKGECSVMKKEGYLEIFSLDFFFFYQRV